MEFFNAFTLVLLSSLATGVGSLVLFLPQAKKEKFLDFSLAFAGGVMLLVSFVEIFPKSLNHLSQVSTSVKITSLTFLFLGFLIFYALSFFTKEKDPVKKISFLVPLVIIAHNIPEGLLTFLGALSDQAFGYKIATAVALHNLPEGLAVALPIYYATKSKTKAITWAFFSGAMETLGALGGYFILKPFLNDWVYGVSFAIIAGIMIIVSLVELLPLSFKNSPKMAQLGLVSGLVFMGISLGLLF